jgi:phytoene synthase
VVTREAYAYCERLAREHYENFPVASWLLPAAMRPHIAAIYAFARRADDVADEPGLPDADRLLRLDEWAARLDRGQTPALSPRGRGLTPDWEPPSARIGKFLRESARGPGAGVAFHDRGLTPGAAGLAPTAGDELIFCALDNTIRTHNLPRSLFHDLLSAFRQDVVTRRYRTWADVLDYCRRSANPVGRLVLRVAGYDSAPLDAQSDALCTALQLTNFWQDLAIDWRRGRLYVPTDDRDRAGAQDADLDAGRVTAEWQTALRQVTMRTRDLFAAGRGVCDGVDGRLRWELRLTWLGGSRILQKTEQAGFDVFNNRPKLTVRDAPALVWAALRWKIDTAAH